MNELELRYFMIRYLDCTQPHFSFVDKYIKIFINKSKHNGYIPNEVFTYAKEQESPFCKAVCFSPLGSVIKCPNCSGQEVPLI